MKRLLYTIAFDPPDSRRQSRMAKMFVTSLVRTQLSGEIVIFRNHEVPLFERRPKNVREIHVPRPDCRGRELATAACAFKYEAINHLDVPKGPARIMFADCDHLALRNIDHLFDAHDADIRWVVERGSHISWTPFRGYLTEEEMRNSSRAGSNSGLWSFKPACRKRLSAEVLRILASPPVLSHKFGYDQPAWNRMLYEGKFSAEPYDVDEVRFPLLWDAKFDDYSRGTLLHFASKNRWAKERLMAGLFAAFFAGSEEGPLIDRVAAAAVEPGALLPPNF